MRRIVAGCLFLLVGVSVSGCGPTVTDAEKNTPPPKGPRGEYQPPPPGAMGERRGPGSSPAPPGMR